ncbi:hypothetical protein BGX38DRAFT_1204750 [Terfezia claveryi]|nr:hypothetical protein BGX38DRAFT_1204750 [Terfezia claveryi]
MKVSLGVALVVGAAGFAHMTAGLTCSSGCSACFKIGSPGVDTKISCKGQDCGTACPPGYIGNSLHCATAARCSCDYGTGPCWEFGPCFYGEAKLSTSTICKTRP